MKINKLTESKKIRESNEPEVLWRNRNRSIIKDGYGFGIDNGVTVNRFHIDNDGKAVYDYEPSNTMKTTVDRLTRQGKFNNPHYSENPKYVGNTLKYGRGVEETFEKDGGPFWYFTKHGLGPGMLPKGVNVVDTKEDDNFGTYIALDKVLTTQELRDYELKEKRPDVKECIPTNEATLPRNASKIKATHRYGDRQSMELSKDGTYWREANSNRAYPSDFLRRSFDIEVLETDPNYKPNRTKPEYVVQGNYGYGWEDLTASDNQAEAKNDLKAYRENEVGVPHRLITRRVPVNESKSLKETYWIDNKEVMDEVDRLCRELEKDGWTYREDKYTGSKYYVIFMKRADGKAVFKAIKYNHDHKPEVIEVTGKQVIGEEPLDSFDGMRRSLGKMLLPQRESNSVKTFGAKGKKLNEANPAELTDCPECGDISFDSKKGRCTKCSYRESLNESDVTRYQVEFYFDGDDHRTYEYAYAESANAARNIIENKYPNVTITGCIAETVPAKYKEWDLKESIEVATIADYITDHYDFDDLDDKYGCINSIKDSFKDEKTISYEVLQQFIGAHNGRDKVNEDIDLIPIEVVPDNRKWQYSVGGKDVPYTSYEDAKAHLKDDYNIEDYREELQAYLDKETGRPQKFFVDATFDGRLVISIHWGDWKHEHNYADYLVRKFFMDKGLGIETDVDVTEEDGSDTYSAEHYYQINDISLSGRVIDEAKKSYGGAFDIADDQYFTKDDLLYFADEVLGNVAETFDGTYDIGGVWFEDGCVVTQIVDEDGNMYEDTTRVDMRKIKEPWHLKRAYGQQVSANIIQQIKEMSESVVSSAHEFDDDVDDLTYYYDDEIFKDNLENSPYTEITSKQVTDSDGFMTDYTMYQNVNTGEYVFVFGDKDVYSPDDGYFDYECETKEEAEEWFNTYNGFTDEDDENSIDWMNESDADNEQEDKKI